MDTPGVLSGEKQRIERNYNFVEVRAVCMGRVCIGLCVRAVCMVRVCMGLCVRMGTFVFVCVHEA